MKTKKIELDVDFIGEQTCLTIKEENALSIFFKEKKAATYKAICKQPLKLVKAKKVFE